MSEISAFARVPGTSIHTSAKTRRGFAAAPRVDSKPFGSSGTSTRGEEAQTSPFRCTEIALRVIGETGPGELGCRCGAGAAERAGAADSHRPQLFKVRFPRNLGGRGNV